MIMSINEFEDFVKGLEIGQAFMVHRISELSNTYIKVTHDHWACAIVQVSHGPQRGQVNHWSMGCDRIEDILDLSVVDLVAE